MSRLSVGVVSYLNARPLTAGLEGESGLELIRMEPSAVAKSLLEGRVDIGLVPSVTLLDGDDLTLILTGERLIEEMRTERTDDDSAEDIALMEKDIALMEMLFDDDDVMRLFYRRRK